MSQATILAALQALRDQALDQSTSVANTGTSTGQLRAQWAVNTTVIADEPCGASLLGGSEAHVARGEPGKGEQKPTGSRGRMGQTMGHPSGSSRFHKRSRAPGGVGRAAHWFTEPTEAQMLTLPSLLHARASRMARDRRSGRGATWAALPLLAISGEFRRPLEAIQAA